MVKQSRFFTMLEIWYDNTTYRCKVCPQKKNDERKLGHMVLGAVKKHAKTAGRKANMNHYL